MVTVCTVTHYTHNTHSLYTQHTLNTHSTFVLNVSLNGHSVYCDTQNAQYIHSIYILSVVLSVSQYIRNRHSKDPQKKLNIRIEYPFNGHSVYCDTLHTQYTLNFTHRHSKYILNVSLNGYSVYCDTLHTQYTLKLHSLYARYTLNIRIDVCMPPFPLRLSRPLIRQYVCWVYIERIVSVISIYTQHTYWRKSNSKVTVCTATHYTLSTHTQYTFWVFQNYIECILSVHWAFSVSQYIQGGVES